jgi:hypothetical protein
MRKFVRGRRFKRAFGGIALPPKDGSLVNNKDRSVKFITAEFAELRRDYLIEFLSVLSVLSVLRGDILLLSILRSLAFSFNYF